MAYNIIFYFTDQQRADTCGCYGQPLDITPNLDRLAKEGVKFEYAAPCSRRESILRKRDASAIILCCPQE